MKEIWKSLKDFPNYKISNRGRVKNRQGKILKTGGNSQHNRYVKIALRNEKGRFNKYLHRIVAEVFCARPSLEHNQVNHKDKNILNNKASNLEWMTPSQNSKHAHKDRKKSDPACKYNNKVTTVSFYWIDSERLDGWEDDLGDIEALCYTEGILVFEGKNSITVTTSIGAEGEHLSALRVPFCAIKGGKKGVIKRNKTIKQKA